MTRVILSVLILCLSCLGADAQTETFSRYFQGLSQAATPLSVEPMIVLQGGLSRQTPVSNLGGVIGSVVSGSSNQIPFYQGAGNTLTPTNVLPPGIDISAGIPTNDQQPNGGTLVWRRVGPVLGGINCGLNNAEHASIIDSNPVILTQYVQVIKMWFMSGGPLGSGNEIRYAEAPLNNPTNFTCYSGNPIVSSTAGGGSGYVQLHGVVKSGSNYYLFPKNVASGNIDRMIFTGGGVTLSTTNSSVLSPSGGAENVGIGNVNVLVEGSQWDAFFYEQGLSNTCSPSVSLCFFTAVATSTNQGLTWGSHTTIIQVASGGPAVYKSLAGAYWMWSGCTLSSDNPTTDLCRFTSSSLTTGWSQNPTGNSLARRGYDEGFGNAGGQLADPAVPIQVGNQTLLYYTANHDQTCATGASITVPCGIKAAIADMPIEQLITTSEGDLPLTAAGWGNPWLFGAGTAASGVADKEAGALQYVPFQTGGIGVLGYNCFENVINSAPRALQVGINGYCNGFIAQNGDTSSQLQNSFIDTAGNVHNAWGADWQAGGALGNFYLFGNGSTKLCIASSGFGDCSSSIKGDDGDGILFGDFKGRLVFGNTQQSEIASPGGTSGFDVLYGNLASHRFQMINNNGPEQLVAGIVTQGTASLGTTGIPSGTCAAAITVSAVNAAVTDTISWSFNAAPGSGWPNLTIQNYPTVNNVNFSVCNPSASTVTPAAATLNWSVIR